MHGPAGLELAGMYLCGATCQLVEYPVAWDTSQCSPTHSVPDCSTGGTLPFLQLTSAIPLGSQKLRRVAGAMWPTINLLKL